jgi:DNA-binding NarL/FixJ family response regulator
MDIPASPVAISRNPERIRVLSLEDNEDDAELIRHELRRSGMASITDRVDSEEAFAMALREFEPDVVLSDHSLAQFDAESALAMLRKVRPTTPLIIVTSYPNSEKTVACLRAGAEDLLIKGNLGRLAASITEALDLRRPLEALTPRQIEVLRLVSEGHRTRDIASRLKLSVKTVESHRGEVMKRLEIHDVVNLVRYALRVGLVAI